MILLIVETKSTYTGFFQEKDNIQRAFEFAATLMG